MTWFKYSINDGTRHFRKLTKHVDMNIVWIFFEILIRFEWVKISRTEGFALFFLVLEKVVFHWEI